MTCLEHLIENCLACIEKGYSYPKILACVKTDPNLEYAGITADQCWEICQYFYYDYLFNKNELPEYGGEQNEG